MEKNKIETTRTIMKRIVVAYWEEHGLIPYFENNSVFEYSIEKQSEIVQIIIEHGLSVMVKPNMCEGDTLLIYIGKGVFQI
jgi:hypothetical protein